MSESEVSDDPTDKVKPMDVDGVNAAIAGTVLFAIGLVVCLLLRTSLAEHDATWWIWVCVAGAAGGILGVIYTTRRRAVYRAAGRMMK